MDGRDDHDSDYGMLEESKKQRFQRQIQIRDQTLNELAELNQTKIRLIARKQRLEQDINHLKQLKFFTENPTNDA